MAWDMEFAALLNRLSKGKRTAATPLRAAVVQTNPLTLCAYDGELLASGDALLLTQTASAREWRTGDQAAVIISAAGMLVIDKM